ncbi:MAG: MoaD/ThiS family protein [Candidatus Diapherotrites archaeon]|nr:MoaD/ThiS family protein [Candidatus Diapherotrites archaeon]
MKVRWRILGGAWKEEDWEEAPLEKIMLKLGLSPEEYIPSVNGKVVTPDYIPKEGDEITFVPVVSGG